MHLFVRFKNDVVSHVAAREPQPCEERLRRSVVPLHRGKGPEAEVAQPATEGGHAHEGVAATAVTRQGRQEGQAAESVSTT